MLLVTKTMRPDSLKSQKKKSLSLSLTRFWAILVSCFQRFQLFGRYSGSGTLYSLTFEVKFVRKRVVRTVGVLCWGGGGLENY